LHHLQREPWRLLNQPQKSLLVDGSNTAISSSYRRSAARLSVDERHLAEHAARVNGFHHGASDLNRDCSLDYCEHAVRRLSLFEDRLALSEGANVLLVT
jgi:hypothetical protein